MSHSPRVLLIFFSPPDVFVTVSKSSFSRKTKSGDLMKSLSHNRYPSYKMMLTIWLTIFRTKGKTFQQLH